MSIFRRFKGFGARKEPRKVNQSRVTKGSSPKEFSGLGMFQVRSS
jgi:hypothetical protein